MNLSTLEIILIISTLLEFNPLFQMIKSVKNKSVKDVSFATFAMIFVIGSLWLYYGLTMDNMPLIIGNGIKLITSFSVLLIYFKYRNKNK